MKLPFKDSPILKVDDLFFNKYPIPELDTGNEEILFRPAWNLNVNDRSLDPYVCSEMPDHLVLSRDRVFGVQVSSKELINDVFPSDVDAGSRCFLVVSLLCCCFCCFFFLNFF